MFQGIFKTFFFFFKIVLVLHDELKQSGIIAQPDFVVVVLFKVTKEVTLTVNTFFFQFSPLLFVWARSYDKLSADKPCF